MYNVYSEFMNPVARFYIPAFFSGNLQLRTMYLMWFYARMDCRSIIIEISWLFLSKILIANNRLIYIGCKRVVELLNTERKH